MLTVDVKDIEAVSNSRWHKIEMLALESSVPCFYYQLS